MGEDDMDKISLTPYIKWNDQVKLIVTDVDETIADVYTPAKPEMINELNSLLEEDKVVFMVTGASLDQVQRRIIDRLIPEKRYQVLVSHCSGAEVWGYNKDGSRNEKPFYSKYDEALSKEQKEKWRDVVKQIVNEFKLSTHNTMPVKDFVDKTHNNPLDVMLEDRGPQITLEFVNAYDLTDDQLEMLETEVPETHGHHDLRIPVMEMAEKLLKEAG